MTIEVFSKPGCGKCQSAKEKIKLMNLNYQEHNIEYHTTPHDGWRQDGSAEVLSAYTDMDTLPLIRINGEFHDYSGAMRVLKDRIRAAATIPAETLASSRV